MAENVLQGIGVSQGIYVGPAFCGLKMPRNIPRHLIAPDGIDKEIANLRAAAQSVYDAFMLARQHLPDTLSAHEDLIDAYLVICNDPKLLGEAVRRIETRRMSAAWALQESLDFITATFDQIREPYIRDRIQDVRLVAHKIMKRLLGVEEHGDGERGRGALVGYDLTPADTFGVSVESLAALVTEQGGSTSHTGIVAKNLGIPAVVGVLGLEEAIVSGDTIIVDGFAGTVTVRPSPAQEAACFQKAEQFDVFQKSMAAVAAFPAETKDGYPIRVQANMDTFSAIETVKASGAEGTGLLRTEFAYMARTALPTEDELYANYRNFAQGLYPDRLTIRTLDMGSDKTLEGLPSLDEPNPAMGMRSIRYCLRHQQVFRQQLGAILRASAYGNTAIMFPMIGSLKELALARSFLEEARQELMSQGIPYDRNMPVGLMIELPAAVFIADLLAREVDFFSIGTNDLIQYTLGVDRGNRHVAHLFQPMHPAVIRSIKFVVDKAHEAGIKVSVCGKMAANPYCIPLLLGMQVDALSMAAQSVPLAKQLVRRVDIPGCRSLLDAALVARDTEGIRRLALDYAWRHFAEYVPFFPSVAE